MGAVNCANRVGDKLVGENTDGKGFFQSLREACDPAGLNVAILGAGGAARAIAVELALSGVAAITIVNRSPERGPALVDLLSSRTSAMADLCPLSGDYAVPAETAIFINATSIGLGDAVARLPISVDSLRPELIVADVVFNPPETWLIRTATDRGCRTIDGLGMLVNQAVISFKIWTGIEPDAGIMRDALEEYLEI
jgi:shikimate dehydrogenase